MKINKREELIRKGKASFIIQRGVMGWIIVTAVLFIVISYIMNYGFNFSSLSNSEFIRQIVISFITFPISGILFGLIMWKALNNQNNNK